MKKGSLFQRFPEIAKEWHPTKNGNLSPSDVTPGSNKKVWWLCKYGHEWQAQPNSRTGRGDRCPYCSGKRTGKDNNLAVKFPELAKEWHPTKNGKLTPKDVTPGSNKKVWWKCENGHEWATQVIVRKKGFGCPFCSGQRVSTKHNLGVKFPLIAKEWHPTKNGTLTPFDVTPRCDKIIWWKCENGHEWQRRVSTRTDPRTKNSSCPICRKERLKSHKKV